MCIRMYKRHVHISWLHMVLAMGPHDDQKAGELDRLDYHSVNCKYLKQRHRRAIFLGQRYAFGSKACGTR